MKLLITWILIFASTLVWGMEEEQWPKTIKTQETITVKSERIQKEKINPLTEIILENKEVKNVDLTAIDISTHPNQTLYLLAKNNNTRNYVFKQHARKDPLKKVKKTYVELYKTVSDNYIAFQYNTNKNLFITKDEILQEILQAEASHNHPIITFGTISDVLFTGSTWPSIKRVNFKNTNNNTPNQSIPFLNNAFLLACSDNGMVIAKINEKKNLGFYFWRRFNEPYACNVTLYALFFNEKIIDTIDKKLIENTLAQAEKSKKATFPITSTVYEGNIHKNTSLTSRENLLNPDKDITVITLVENVELTANELEDYAKKLPKAAVGNNCAVVVHTQKGSTLTKDNPMVSYVYKKGDGKWHTNAQTLKDFLGKEKIITPQNITPYTITHPNLYEIKELYLYREDATPTVLLITKVGFSADGVYKVALEKKVKEKSLYWHVPLKINTYSLSPTEQIVASTFNKASHTLYLVTNNNIENKETLLEQELITIDFKNKIQKPHLHKENK